MLWTPVLKLSYEWAGIIFYLLISVTRLGDLLDFGQLFEVFANN